MRNPEKILTTCHGCWHTRPAYVLNLKKTLWSRSDKCPACKAVKPVSKVQSRLVWQSWKTITGIANKIAQRRKLCPSQCADAAMAQAQRFIRRYSRFNRTPKNKPFSVGTFLSKFLTISMARWSYPNESFKHRHFHFEPIADYSFTEEEKDVLETMTTTELAEVIRSELAQDEYEKLVRYTQGKIGWTLQLEQVFAKARIAIMDCSLKRRAK